jgi:glycerophosphoryl diester phosphodiesterase
VGRASRLGCLGLHPHRALVDAALLAECRRVGLAVRAWTVNEPDEIRSLMALAVDGIVTDRPDVVASLAGRGGGAS